MTNNIVDISKQRPLLPGMPATAAQDKLSEIQAVQVFVDAFIALKDRERACEAVEYKLRCQREYVMWRDARTHPDGTVAAGRPKSFSTERLPENDPGDLTAFRWRKALVKNTAYDKAIPKEQEKVISMLERGSIRQKDLAEFFTPAPIIELARNVLGQIDLDPASCPRAQKIVQAAKFIGKKEDGLKYEWHGNIWLNPPFGINIVPQFVDKLLTEIEAKRAQSAILLVNNCTETRWFSRAARSADAICFHIGRMSFETVDGLHEVTQGQAMLYWGNAVEQFKRKFSTIGWIAIPVSATAV